jgi:hypothetical protein
MIKMGFKILPDKQDGVMGWHFEKIEMEQKKLIFFWKY